MLATAMINGMLIMFLAFLGMTYHFESTEIMFSGCTVLYSQPTSLIFTTFFDSIKSR